MKSVARVLGTSADAEAKSAHRQASPTSATRVLGPHGDSTRTAQDFWSLDTIALERHFGHVPAIVRSEVFDELRRKLSNVIAGATVRNRQRLLSEIDSVLADTLAKLSAPPDRIVDRETQLVLPPLPRTPFKTHRSKYRSTLTATTFLKREWGDYTQAFLLYSDHLRAIDRPLYEALRYQAKKLGKDQVSHFLSLGILSLAHTTNPPPGLERQAAVLRAARQRLHAHARLLSGDRFASEAEPKDQRG